MARHTDDSKVENGRDPQHLRGELFGITEAKTHVLAALKEKEEEK